jgi:parallel beta-helix repeat protein
MRLLLRRRAAARRALALVGLATWIAVAQPARAADYYVATSGGSNGGPGSAAMPWATLQHAADSVHSGDRVIVRPGHYTGFYLDSSGTAASPIEFFAEPGALITQRNATTPDGINLEGASHVIIDGFAVTGMPRAGVRSVLGEFVTVRNVHAYDNQRWGIFTGFVDDLLIENNETSGSILEHGIYVSNSGDRPVLRGNVSWGNHGSGIHMNGDLSQGGDGIISGALVSGNRIYDNAKPINGGPVGGGSGINLDGVQDSRIQNNLVYGNRASGISLYSIDGAEGSTGNLVINNTIHQPSNGRWALNIRDGSTGNTALNNILVTEHSYRGAISIWADSLEGFVSDYNVLASRFTTDDGDSVRTLTEWQTATGNDANSKVASAPDLFADWPAGDYRLKPGAAAIDAGTTMHAPTVDLLGHTRPQGANVDMGAIESTSASTQLAADFDDSGAVDGADLAILLNGFGAGNSTMQGDADGDHDVDGVDFLTWQRQLGASPRLAEAIPEPSAQRLLVAGAGFFAIGVWFDRRKEQGARTSQVRAPAVLIGNCRRTV